MHPPTASDVAESISRDDPAFWLASTSFLDLEDSKLRLRARALTQLCKNEREKALAIYGFVKRIPFARPFTLRLRMPREVLDAGRGDALDKVGLLVALLRIVGIPARIRYVEQSGEMLRGLISHMTAAARPLAEISLGGKWLATDTYIFDAAYMAAARERLQEHNWECGYGIHRTGHTIWDGMVSAYLGGLPSDQDPMVLKFLGAFSDPAEFVASEAFAHTHPLVTRSLHWNMMVPSMGKVIRDLHEEGSPGFKPGSRKPP